MSKVIHLFPGKKPDGQEGGINVRGNKIVVANNVVAGRDINVNTRVVRRTNFTPGPEHISSKGRKRIKALIDKAVDQDVEAGRSPTRRRAYAKWWSIYKNHFEVTTYQETPRELEREAIEWLRQRIAINRRRPRRTAKLSWREDQYAAIYARARETGMSKAHVYGLVRDKLGKRVTSLKQLSDKNLERLYRIMMRRPR